MPAEIDRNQIDSDNRGRSTAKGDAPEALRRRYYLDEHGGPGLGFYSDARTQVAAFRDLGPRLVAPRPDPNAIRDMTAIARHRGWDVVTVHGEADFRREAWLAARYVGIEARGYQPTERDRQELERRMAAARRADRDKAPAEGRGAKRDEIKTLRVVEAVVRSRVSERPAQDRIIAAARGRIADWLERGVRLESIDLPVKADRGHGRERQRDR